MRPQLNRPRRAFLMRIAVVAGLAVVTTLVGRSTPTAAKATKSDFMYQDHRHDGKGCGQCRFFSPDGPSSDTGTCSIVEGVISRNGWCAAFAQRILA